MRVTSLETNIQNYRNDISKIYLLNLLVSNLITNIEYAKLIEHPETIKNGIHNH